IPLVIAIATSMAARAGILVRDRLSLERMRLFDIVLFDKPGTLTRGAHAVVGTVATDGDDGALLALAGAAEEPSEHPLARAVVAAATHRSGDLPEAHDFRALPGRGVQARLDGSEVAVGGPALVRAPGGEPPPPRAHQSASRAARGGARV